MGIDIKGGMIVGERASKLDITEEMLEAYECEDESEFFSEILDFKSPYFDSDVEDWVVGYDIPDVSIGSSDWGLWIDQVEEAAKNFERLTGIPARLIGMQHVY